MQLTGVSCNNTAVPQQQYVCYKGISQIQNSITGAEIYAFEWIRVKKYSHPKEKNCNFLNAFSRKHHHPHGTVCKSSILWKLKFEYSSPGGLLLKNIPHSVWMLHFIQHLSVEQTDSIVLSQSVQY